MNREVKERILELLTEPMVVAGQAGPLMVGLHRVVASLVRCYAGEQKRLDLPEAQTLQVAQMSREDQGDGK